MGVITEKEWAHQIHVPMGNSAVQCAPSHCDSNHVAQVGSICMSSVVGKLYQEELQHSARGCRTHVPVCLFIYPARAWRQTGVFHP